MSFSKEWEKKYQDNLHLSVWPWTDLVSYVLRYSKPQKTVTFNVLELGVGAGANIPFFLALGVNYYGIDGSPTIVKELHNRFPTIQNQIVVGDFTENLVFDVDFDLVVDRAALTHNTTDSIINSLKLIHDRMKVGGGFIGIDWFSINHSDFVHGESFSDNNTCELNVGHLSGLGNVHFSSHEHMLELFHAFDVQVLEEKLVNRIMPVENAVFASWNVYAKKQL